MAKFIFSCSLFELVDYISNYYDGIRKEAKEKEVLQDVFETLVTKELMVSLGCCPVYDKYFEDGLTINWVCIAVLSR